MNEACDDAYKRLIYPSVEREIRAELTSDASEAATKVFGLNLKSLLMQPPVKGKVTLGLTRHTEPAVKPQLLTKRAECLTQLLYTQRRPRIKKGTG